jgi:NTE family protein
MFCLTTKILATPNTFAMKNNSAFFCIVAVIYFCCQATPFFAQSQNEKIGLVLSGGGAKGIAQVGVIKLLEKEGFRPDIITGASIGSILGGLYAIGYTPEDLERLAMDTDWEYYFDDELERNYFPIEERYAAERYQLRFPLLNGKIGLPTGIVRGKKISLLLSRLTIPAHGIYNFDKFDIPYRAVVTNFETGEAIAMGAGDLADVMRASMSIPSVFVPCEIDSIILIDGGVGRNLPVIDALTMGAGKIIAIDIGAPLNDRSSLENIMDVLDQTSSYRIAETNIRQSLLADVVIKPEIADISALSFDQNDTLMQRGIRAAQQKMTEVKALLENRKPLQPRGVHIPTQFEVVELKITGCDLKASKRIRNALQIKTGKIYSLETVENKLKSLYGTEMVALASYRLLPTNRKNAYVLLVKVETQKGEFVRISANYSPRLKAAMLFNLTLRDRFINGSKLNVDVKVSENPSLDMDYFVHTAGRPNVGGHLRGRVNFFPGQTFSDGSRIARFDLRHMAAEANVFSTLNNQVLLSSGMGIERYVRSEEYFDDDDNNLVTNQLFNQVRFFLDRYKESYFPREGHQLLLEAKYAYNRSIDRFAADSTSTLADDNTILRIGADKAFPLSRRLSAVLGVHGGYILNVENNYLNRFYLGKALVNEMSHVDFYGLRYMEIPVTGFAFGQAKLQTEIVPEVFTTFIFNGGYYESKSFQTEGAVVSNKVFTEKDFIYGFGLELGTITRLGPITFSAEYNLNLNRMNFYFHLGHEF